MPFLQEAKTVERVLGSLQMIPAHSTRGENEFCRNEGMYYYLL
jgi:hypothetical protein